MEHSIESILKSIELNWIQLQMKNWNKKDFSNFFIKRIQRHSKTNKEDSTKKNSKKFVWENVHEEAFKSFIKILTDTNSPVLGHFNPGAQAISITDASKVGFGMTLLLRDKENLKCLCTLQCHSQMVSDLESRYMLCELEAKGILFRTRKYWLYLKGIEFEVWTDHAPMVNIYNGSYLKTNKNERIKGILSKTAHFEFEVKWVPGPTGTNSIQSTFKLAVK